MAACDESKTYTLAAVALAPDAAYFGSPSSSSSAAAAAASASSLVADAAARRVLRAELDRACRQALPALLVPRRCWALKGSDVPVLANGKVDRAALLGLLAAAQARYETHEPAHARHENHEPARLVAGSARPIDAAPDMPRQAGVTASSHPTQQLIPLDAPLYNIVAGEGKAQESQPTGAWQAGVGRVGRRSIQDDVRALWRSYLPRAGICGRDGNAGGAGAGAAAAAAAAAGGGGGGGGGGAAAAAAGETRVEEAFRGRGGDGYEEICGGGGEGVEEGGEFFMAQGGSSVEALGLVQVMAGDWSL